MVVIILINIVLILYVYFKYYVVPKDTKVESNEIGNNDAIVIGYLNDNGFVNNFDLLLAEIVELNIKGYIRIDFDENKIDKYDYIIRQQIGLESNNLNDYEIHVLSYLFSKKTEITKNELEEKLEDSFKAYQIQYNDLKKIINNEIVSKNIIDENKKKNHFDNVKKYRKISVIIFFVIIILGFFGILETSLIYISMYILEKIILFLLLSNVHMFTKYGLILKYNIDNYKLKLEDKEFLTEKTNMKEVLLDKEFARSIALHIKTNAKSAFIDDMVSKDAKEISKNVIINMAIIASILLLVGIIIYKIIEVIPISGLVWIFIGFAIFAAVVFDVAHSLGQKK